MALSTTNPLIAQGNLNRLLGSVQVTDFPQLNISASYLGRAGISLRRMTPMSDIIDTMTGIVISPAPYVRVEVMAHLLRTQGLAALWEAQGQLSTILGEVTVRLDVSNTTLIYPITNCAFMQVDPLNISGGDPDYTVMVEGAYYINSQLWT